MGIVGWPTTLRFSRRLGESVRDSHYAAAIEGPTGQAMGLLDRESGLVAWLVSILDRLGRARRRVEPACTGQSRR